MSISAATSPPIQRGLFYPRKAGSAVDVGAFELLAPISIGGRVSDANGRGIANAVISLTLPNGATRTLLTNPFGYYRFNGIEVGQRVTISVTSKRYNSAAQASVIATGDVTDLNFTLQ